MPIVSCSSRRRTTPSRSSVSREVIDIYQNRTLEPEKAQGARLASSTSSRPGFSWTGANPSLSKEARDARESALRESAQYELAKAEGVAGSDAYADVGDGRAASAFGVRPRAGPRRPGSDPPAFRRSGRLYAKYMADYGASDSARAVDNFYAEALFGDGQYARAGAEYARTAYAIPRGHESRRCRRPSSARVRTRSSPTTRR